MNFAAEKLIKQQNSKFMMKRKGIFLVLLAATLFIQAKDYKLVIRNGGVFNPTNTEVKVDGLNDSIIVVPGMNTQTLTINIKDSEENVISSQVLPVGIDLSVNVETPNSPEVHVLEIRDDNGVVYSEYGN